MRHVRMLLESQLLGQSLRELCKASPLGDYAADAFAQLIAKRLEESTDVVR